MYTLCIPLVHLLRIGLLLGELHVYLLQNSFLDELFENLQTLCNIFIVKAENLSQVCSEEPYVSTNSSLLLQPS